jgi:hypothetical protein
MSGNGKVVQTSNPVLGQTFFYFVFLLETKIQSKHGLQIFYLENNPVHPRKFPKC